MKAGDVVENFQLKNQNGEIFDLYDNLNSDVLLVFYPKDYSLICTKQLKDYSLRVDEFENAGVKIVGINIGPSESHKKFCDSLKISFPLLSDTDKKVSKLFGAINFLGQNKRKLVLIDRNKRVKFIRTLFPIFYQKSEKLLRKFKKA